MAELEGKQERAISTNSLLNIHIFINFNHYSDNYLMEFSISKKGHGACSFAGGPMRQHHCWDEVGGSSNCKEPRTT